MYDICARKYFIYRHEKEYLRDMDSIMSYVRPITEWPNRWAWWCRNCLLAKVNSKEDRISCALVGNCGWRREPLLMESAPNISSFGSTVSMSPLSYKIVWCFCQRAVLRKEKTSSWKARRLWAWDDHKWMKRGITCQQNEHSRGCFSYLFSSMSRDCC